MFGLRLEDDDAGVFGIWPENALTVAAFSALETQWNWIFPPNGVPLPIGLRYEALPEIWRRFGIRKKQRADILDGLREMELALAAPLFNVAGGA